MIALTNWFVTIGVRGAAALMVWSWQALALLALVWPALKVSRMKSPALRHQVWLFGLVAVATLPLSSLAVQSFPSLRSSGPALNYVVEAPQAVIDFASQPPVQTFPAVAPQKAATAPAVKAPAKTPIVPRSPFLVLFAAIFAAWMIGALIALARLMKNHLGVRRAIKRAQAVRPADLDFGEFSAFVRGEARLRLSTEISSPVLCGVFRPTILLPADVVEWTTPDERAAMIQHELAHVERRDPIVNLFQTALSVIFYFHPLVRYACRQLSLEREMACDDRVISSGVAAEAYAAGILKSAERSVIAGGAPGGAHQLAIFGARQILERRLEMILSTDRARTIAHQWRYLVLPIAIIAAAGFLLIPRHSTQNSPSNSMAKDSPKPAKVSTAKVTYSRQEQELIDMIQQVAEAIPQQWPNRYFKSGLPDERLLFGDFRLYDKRSSLTIIPPRPKQFSRALSPAKVEVGDFELSIKGDSAVIDFIGAIHLSFPDQDKEEVVTDPYRVRLMRVRGQWQASNRNKPLSVGAMFWPPPPPRVAYPAYLELQGAWAEAQKATPDFKIVNTGDAEFSVQSSSTPDNSQSAEAPFSDLEHRTCRCSASPVQNAVMKLAELELRGEKGVRFSHAEKGVQEVDQDGLRIFAVDAIHFKDRFELRWGEQTYYGLGSVKASYHLERKRLDIGSFPETRLYRTPDRTGEPITLQQLAQELKDQSLRKN
jgi:beta-lactamase regulating signal transducer with metallopeptidase domain